MARRTLSFRGRIVAAGVSVAVGGVLAGFMAAADHTASASPTANDRVSSDQSGGSTGATATPYGNDRGGDGSDVPGSSSGTSGVPSQPQPQTRTGGS